MSARRLNDSEKQAIIDLYRQAGETTMTLADRYGVSNSTIGRILKSGLADGEYDTLVQAKRGRGAEIRSERAQALITAPVLAAPLPDEDEWEETPLVAIDEADEEDEDWDEDDDDRDPPEADEEFLEVVAELEGFVIGVDADELGDDLDDDLDEDFDDDAEEEFDDSDTSSGLSVLHIETGGQKLTVRPFATAAMPKVCYLVVDRNAELIAPTLRQFGELGEMSRDELDLNTLPIFDNHRVAKRFSNIRTQRVIKVPDSQIFYKVAHHLVAKGIKRLLFDGQVYGL
jgi:hypothetical protein